MYNFLSTVYDDVFNKGMTLTAEQPVQLLGVGQKMAIMGYAPCSIVYNLFMAHELAISKFSTVKNNIVIEQTNQNLDKFPVASTISRIETEKVELDKYLDLPFVFGADYPRFSKLRSELIKGKFSGNIHPYLKSRLECVDSKIWYICQEKDLLFTRFDNRNIAIADAFLCVCAYTNPIRGNVEYQVFNPQELTRIDHI